MDPPDRNNIRPVGIGRVWRARWECWGTGRMWLSLTKSAFVEKSEPNRTILHVLHTNKEYSYIPCVDVATTWPNTMNSVLHMYVCVRRCRNGARVSPAKRLDCETVVGCRMYQNSPRLIVGSLISSAVFVHIILLPTRGRYSDRHLTALASTM